MKLQIIGALKYQPFLKPFIDFLENSLLEKKILKAPSRKTLTIAFVSPKRMQSLNQQFLKKNYVTDVLSFSSNQNNCFGELAICLSQIKLQAKAHGLAPEKELAYMVLHGVLHLLGYRHEGGGPLAKKMYQIQDDIFNKWCQKDM